MSRRVDAPAPGPSSKSAPETPSKLAQDKQVRLLSTDVGHLSLVRALHMADFITLLNGFCGVMSIFSSLRYCLGPSSDRGVLWTAFFFMPFGLFFDFMDGRVARWRKKSSLMGQELDSLADLLSFGMAPAVAAYALGFRSVLDQVILAFFVLCGLLRLARFNVTVATLPKDGSGKSKFFEGTPIPTTMGTAAIMAYWFYQGLHLDKLPLGACAAGTILEFHPVVLIFALHGSLMVSKTVRVPKP